LTPPTPRSQLLGDLAGGLIAALVALPYGLALARQMGLPPELGILTSLLTAPITALLGRNPVLIGGTASATVPFIASAAALQGIPGAVKVCLAASLLMLLFALLRLGRYVAKVPHSVLSGFSCGVGAMMVILQLRTILGLTTSGADRSATPLAQLAAMARQLPQSRIEPSLLAAAVILGASLLSRKWPRSPSPLLGVGLAVGLDALFGWHEQALGSISLRMPTIPRVDWQSSDLRALFPTAVGLAFVSSVNILITSRVVEHFQGRHRHLRPADADRELAAYGLANTVASLFAAPMSVGIPARSLANVRCGGTTRLSNLAHAVFLLILVLAGAGLIAHIPLAALAGVTAYVGIGLLEWSTWRRLHRMRKVDAAAFLTTAFAVLTTNAVAAVALGCALHLLRHIARSFTPAHQLTLAEPPKLDN
jgi:SulP family sulfate permease